MKFTNLSIYQIAENLTKCLKESDIYIPAKANFFIQKNILTFINAAQEIDKTRIEIIKHYGILDENTQNYTIPDENVNKVEKEFNDLFSVEQELEVKTFSIEDLDNINLTPAQMQAMIFMIEERA